MPDPRRTTPQRVTLASGKRPLRPSPVTYRRQDERDYLRAARHATVRPLDDLLRAARKMSAPEIEALVRGAEFLRPTRARSTFLDRVVDARAGRLREFSNRRWNLTMRGTLSPSRLAAGDEAVNGVLGQWQARERERWRLTLGDTRNRLRQLDFSDKDRLLKQLRRERDIAFRRTRRVTREGVMRANGQMNAARQEAAGIREYIWISQRDDRVRPEHVRLDGKVRRWSSSPRPGEPPGCRCFPIPNVKPG